MRGTLQSSLAAGFLTCLSVQSLLFAFVSSHLFSHLVLLFLVWVSLLSVIVFFCHFFSVSVLQEPLTSTFYFPLLRQLALRREWLGTRCNFIKCALVYFYLLPPRSAERDGDGCWRKPGGEWWRRPSSARLLRLQLEYRPSFTHTIELEQKALHPKVYPHFIPKYFFVLLWKTESTL